MIGELKYFLGFQIKQLEDVTFISQKFISSQARNSCEQEEVKY
jgi:hypothetical protein